MVSVQMVSYHCFCPELFLTQWTFHYNKGQYSFNIIIVVSHFVAFIAFEMLWRRYPRLDIYNFLRMPVEEQVIEYSEFKATCERFTKVLFDLERNKKIQTADYMKEENIDNIIETGINNVGILHTNRPLLKNKNGDILTKDLNLLYYYHNRLAGYELEKYI